MNRKFQGSSSRRFLVSSKVRSGPEFPYFFTWLGVKPQDLSNLRHRSINAKLGGASNGRQFFRSARAIIRFEKFLPRAASVIFFMSSTKVGTLRKRGTGAHSLVCLLTISAVPTPQFGWQPQLTVPQCESGPCAKSAKAEKALISEIGNQSRVGSTRPLWLLTSLARCESV